MKRDYGLWWREFSSIFAVIMKEKHLEVTKVVYLQSQVAKVPQMNPPTPYKKCDLYETIGSNTSML